MRSTHPARRSGALGLFLATLASGALANTYTVTTTADSGAGSLRQAILDANANPAADTITFNIAASGVQTIAPTSQLPTITDAVTIDGYTQPGALANTNPPDQGTNAVLMIEIDGTNASFGGVLMTQGPANSNVTIRGLVINRSPGVAIIIFGQGSNFAVEGCFLGTDPTGLTTIDRDNAEGVLIDSSATNVRIGGTTPAARNVISGNSSTQIAFGCNNSAGGTGHLIQGNLIGPDATGAAKPPFNFQGQNNGLNLCYGVSNVTVGGTTAAERNVISGNVGVGVNLASSFSNDVHDNTIRGNYIGTDVTGSARLGNGGGGIQINQGNNSVFDNVISANGGEGVAVSGSNISIQGNKIGTDAGGTAALGNSGTGVHTYNASAKIGGTGAGEPNVIAYNGTNASSGHGVRIEGNTTGNAVRANSIHDNVGLGISFGGGGGTPTPNDPGDADTGPNGVQNYPVLSTLTPTVPETPETGVRIQGVLHSTPSTIFDLDFFSNPACVKFPKDFLEGTNYLGSGVVTTDGSGTGIVDVTVPIGIAAGEHVSATATDPAGNTSEFSQRLPFSVLPASGDAAGGTAITVAGTDFEDGAVVTIGGAPATSIVIGSSTSLTAVTPALAAGSSSDLVVTNTDATTGTLVKGWVADFLDVPGGQQFHQFVTTLVSNAITAGVGGGLYGVGDDTLRQQMAVFLLKAKYGLCYTPPPCTVAVFTDVPCSSGFAPWINELVAEGITGGCGGGNYCPANPVLRQQMAVLLLRTDEAPGYAPPACVTATFDDVPCSSNYAPWIYELVARNITAGCGGGNYCPTLTANRGQMATFVVKTFSLQ